MTNPKSEDKPEKTKTKKEEVDLAASENEDIELSDDKLTKIAGGDGRDKPGGG